MTRPRPGFTRPAVAIATLTALAALLAGCGSSGSPSSSGGQSAAPTGASANGSSASASSTPGPDVTESNPPGDIPDNQAFVPYAPAGGLFSVKVPEGWARSTDGAAVTFTDKLNSIRMETVAAGSAPSVSSARQQELPAIASSAPQYAPGDVTSVSRAAGEAVLITYLADSPPDPVTGKVVRDAVERYEFWRSGHEVVLTLSGPKGADNVDPWRIVTDSLTWA